MTFEEALKAMRDGKKVKREIWETGRFYSLANGVGIFDNYGTRVYMLNEDDVLSDDWEIVND